jgi:hypothetical protein
MVAITWAALAPFAFRPPNRISWLDEGNGIRFGAHALAHSDGELVWPGGRAFTIELWVVPSKEPRRQLGRIFALHDDEELPLLSIDHWQSHLIVRDRFHSQDEALRYREHGASEALPMNEPRFIALTSEPAGTQLYVDGHPTEVLDKPPIIGDDQVFGGLMVVGNSIRGNQSWEGVISGIAIYDRALGASEIGRHASSTSDASPSALIGSPGLLALYLFTEGKGEFADSRVARAPALAMPSVFQPLRRTILHWPGAGDRSRGWYQQDLRLNVVGFLPLGLMIALLLRRRGEARARARILRTILYAGAFSLAIELTQVLIPSRVSSISDVAANAAGGGLGAALDALWTSTRLREWWRKASS